VIAAGPTTLAVLVYGASIHAAVGVKVRSAIFGVGLVKVAFDHSQRNATRGVYGLQTAAANVHYDLDRFSLHVFLPN